MTVVPIHHTNRLILRPLKEYDVDPLHQMMGLPEVMRYFPNPALPSRERIERMIDIQIKHWDKYGYGWWAVDSRSEEKTIGWSGLQFLPETKEVEIAYLIAKPYWGQGLATEAAQVGLTFGFENIGLEQIVAIVHPENIASQRVAQKLGMNFVDRSCYFGMECFRYSLHHEGTQFDHPPQS
jgi:ribosomal-protein-alanine N-acetyltransferase